MLSKINFVTPIDKGIGPSNGKPSIKLYYEETEEFPDDGRSGRGAGGESVWSELREIITGLEVGGRAIRIHFDTRKLANNAMSAAGGFAKRTRADWTIQSRILPNKQDTNLWLYIRKIQKDPATWGNETRKKRK